MIISNIIDSIYLMFFFLSILYKTSTKAEIYIKNFRINIGYSTAFLFVFLLFTVVPAFYFLQHAKSAINISNSDEIKEAFKKEKKPNWPSILSIISLFAFGGILSTIIYVITKNILEPKKPNN